MNNLTKLGLSLILAVSAIVLLNIDNINPNWVTFYKAKRLQEKTFLSLKPDPSTKADYLGQLLEKRLAELENLVKDKKYQFLLTASLRYSATAGEVTDLVVANRFNEKIPALKSKFISHKVRLQNLLDIYPKDIEGNVEYKYIIDDINYLDLYLVKLT